MRNLYTGMHGRSKMATTPASDAAMCEGRRCLRFVKRFFFLRFPNSRRFGPNWSVSAETADIRRNSKKKKSAKRTKEVVVTRT